MTYLRSLLLIASLLLLSCAGPDSSPARVFYLNSYHPGYGSSDDVEAGIKAVLSEREIELKVFYLDSKRHTDEEAIRQKAEEALQSIRDFNPDVLITSDDNAVKYVVTPHFRGKELPVVFCGVNWSAAPYGLPASNVTGMLEVLPLAATIDTMRRYYPEIQRVFTLSENTTSERKNRKYLDSILTHQNLSAEYALVDRFESWKSAFLDAQESSDIVFLPTNGAIKNWDDGEAQQFVDEHIKKPVVTCDDFMMPYALFGLTKVAREQGEWAATRALEVIDGRPPHAIPLSRNQKTQAFLNTSLARKIGFQASPALKSSAQEIK